MYFCFEFPCFSVAEGTVRVGFGIPTNFTVAEGILKLKFLLFYHYNTISQIRSVNEV